MNCSNCGAPMKLAHDRHYYHCEYCTSIYFPEESRDGIRALEEYSEVNCPVCRVSLLHAWIDKTAVLYCGRCRGILLDQNVFLATLRYLRARSTEPPERPRPINPQELAREILCPSCGRKMDTHPYCGPGNIVVDNCPHCTLIWLDTSEIGRVVRAPGRDRGEWL